jgi:hypothetical protein
MGRVRASRVCVALVCWVSAWAFAEDPRVMGLVVDGDGLGIEDAGLVFFDPPRPAPIVRVPGNRLEVPLDQLSGPLTEEAFAEVLRLARAPDFESTPIATARTDPWGRYTMPGLGRDAQVILTARGQRAAFRGEEGSGWPVKLGLPPAGELVVNESTERVPIAGAEVTLIPLAPRSGHLVTRHTDALGRVPMLLRGQSVLAIVRAAGYPPTALVLGDGSQELMLLTRLRQLKGRVVEAGRPAAGAIVEVIGEFTPRVSTDGEGAFTIPAARWGAELRAERGTSVGFLGPFSPGPLEMRPGAEVHFVVTDAATGAPVAASPRSTSYARTDTVVQERPGSYLTPRIPAGAGRLDVRAEGYQPATIDFVVEPPARTEIALAMVPLHPLKVILRDGPAYPAHVHVQPLAQWTEAGVKGATLLQWQPSCRFELVESDGRGGHATALPTGRYLLRFSKACTQPEDMPQLSHRACEGPRPVPLTVRRCPVFEQVVSVPSARALEFTVPPGGWR